ncbi:MAG: hypothetical protein GX542_13315 [Rhodococcus sp.]|nr:hypothetical protein [Rhodococcus sp. (in: high G+C Gram-positive bacteria)]
MTTPQADVDGALDAQDVREPSFQESINDVVQAAWNERNLLGTTTAAGKQLLMDPDEMRLYIAGCQELADDMNALEQRARKTLVLEDYGLGDRHIPSAAQLANKFRVKAQGEGGATDDPNTMVGYARANRKAALAFKTMLERSLAAYQGQEEALRADIAVIGESL